MASCSKNEKGKCSRGHDYMEETRVLNFRSAFNMGDGTWGRVRRWSAFSVVYILFQKGLPSADLLH